jgi:hypothetical protein
MANVVTSKTILDGPSLVTLQVSGVLDTSDLTDYVLIDPASGISAIDPATGELPTGFGVKAIEYDIEPGLRCTVYFEAITVESVLVPGDDDDDDDVYEDVTTVNNELVQPLTGSGVTTYRRTGHRWCSLTDRTGRILLSTTGWATGSKLGFSIVLYLRKLNS